MQNLIERLSTGAIVALVIPIAALVAWLIWLAPVVVASIVLGAFTLAIAAGVAHLWARVVVYLRRNNHTYLKADKVIEQTKATVQVAPLASSYHFAPRTETTTATHPQLALPEPEQGTKDILVPSFAQLLDSGRIRPGMKEMVLGFYADTGQELPGTWAQLFSCGIGGLQGSGKSWLAAQLLAQSALMGARLVICDPNPNDDESLSRRVAPLHPTFLCDIASDDRAILDALKLAKEKLERRKAGQAGRWDIVVAIDEWLALRRGSLADLLPLLVESFSTEGRKYAVNCMLMAQRWDKAIAGDFRNTLASSYLFRMRADEARMLTGMRSETLPKDTLELKPGQAYLLDTSGMCRKVVFPVITMDDMERVGMLVADMHRPGAQPIGFRLPAPAGIVPSATVDSNGTVTGQQVDSNHELLSKAPESLTPEAARAVDLFLAGERLPDIVRKVRNVDPAKGGRAGRQATDDVFEMIRNAMTGGNR